MDLDYYYYSYMVIKSIKQINFTNFSIKFIIIAPVVNYLVINSFLFKLYFDFMNFIYLFNAIIDFIFEVVIFIKLFMVFKMKRSYFFNL